MGIEDIGSIGVKAFENSGDFNKFGTQLGAKIDDDEGAISTMFGVPVGTQFGTALFGSGDSFLGSAGILAVDILTDPLTYLTFGFSGISKLSKASKLMKGLSTADKMSEMNKVVKMAKAATKHPELAKAITVASEAGDVKAFTTAAKDFRKAASKSGHRFDKVGEKGFSDLKQLLGGGDLKLLETAFEFEKKFGTELQQFTHTTAEMIRDGKRGVRVFNRPFGIGSKDPVQISKIFNINNAPVGTGKKALSRAIEKIELGAVKGAEGAAGSLDKLIGATGVANTFNKYSAAFALNKEKGGSDLVGEILFLKNDEVARIAEKSITDVDAFVSHTLADQGVKFPSTFKRSMTSVHDNLDEFGEGGKYISGAMNGIRVATEHGEAKHSVQLGNIFGKGQVYKKSIRKTVDAIRGKHEDDAFGLIMEGVEAGSTKASRTKAFNDQVQTLTHFLDTGDWLHNTPGFTNHVRPGVGAIKSANIIKNSLHDIAQRSSRAGIEVISAQGVREEFQAIDNFFPHIHNFQGAGAGTIRDKITQSLVDKAGVKGAKSIEALRKSNPTLADGIELEVGKVMQGISDGYQKKRFGSLENHRQFNMPGWKGDPLTKEFDGQQSIDALKIYFRASEERLARINFFGQDNGKLENQLAKIANDLPDTGASEYADKAVKAFNGEHVITDQAAFDAVAAINSIQVVNKLAAGSAVLTNLGQSVNTAARTGLKNTIKSFGSQVKAAFKGDVDKFEQMGVITNSILQEERIVENSATKLADIWLDWTGFSRVERFNRRVAAHSSVLYGDDLAKSLKSGGKRSNQSARELKKLGLNEDEINLVKQEGTILPGNNIDEATSAGMQRKIASHIVEKTQFRTQVQDLPLWNSSYQGKFLGLFKSFLIKQHGFITKEVVKPAVDFAVTGGKRGRIAPLIAMAGTGVAAGEIIRNMKVMLDGGERPNNIVDRLSENIGQTGVIGAFEIGMGISKFGDKGFSNAIGGPNIDSLGTVLQSAVGNKDIERSAKEFGLRFLGPFGKRQIRSNRDKKNKRKNKRLISEFNAASGFTSGFDATGFNQDF